MSARFIALCVVLTACDDPPLCDTQAIDTLGAHVLAADADTFPVASGEAVVRSMLASMDVDDAIVSARYTLVQPEAAGALSIAQVDCADGRVLQSLESTPELLQPLDVTCDGDCTVEVCLRVENTGAETITVDDAVTVLF